LSDPRIPWLQLAAASWLGETVKSGLIRTFGSPEAVFAAHPQELSRVQGWDHRRLERFKKERAELSPVCLPEILDKKGITLIRFSDPEYPPLLKQIPDAPIVLFARGRHLVDPRPHLAIVGARNATQMGYDISRQFAQELAAAGFVIVSGLALGIDTFAHIGALAANGRTIAVLGCGVDLTYPAGNRKTRREIEESGLVVSEFPPGTPARPWHFPIRNRLISGMCLGTLVIEATPQSGSLITARLAGEQNREIFAVPGSIRSELSQGTHALINDGAVLVTDPRQLIDHFASYLPPSPDGSDKPSDVDLSVSERELLTSLGGEPVHLDHLLSGGRWPKEELFSLLLTLELRDIVVKYPGNFFQAKYNPPKGVK
jgi:DNA processing protein